MKEHTQWNVQERWLIAHGTAWYLQDGEHRHVANKSSICGSRVPILESPNFLSFAVKTEIQSVIVIIGTGRQSHR